MENKKITELSTTHNDSNVCFKEVVLMNGKLIKPRDILFVGPLGPCFELFRKLNSQYV